MRSDGRGRPVRPGVGPSQRAAAGAAVRVLPGDRVVDAGHRWQALSPRLRGGHSGALPGSEFSLGTGVYYRRSVIGRTVHARSISGPDRGGGYGSEGPGQQVRHRAGY